MIARRTLADLLRAYAAIDRTLRAEEAGDAPGVACILFDVLADLSAEIAEAETGSKRSIFSPALRVACSASAACGACVPRALRADRCAGACFAGATGACGSGSATEAEKAAERFAIGECYSRSLRRSSCSYAGYAGSGHCGGGAS